jgi:Zn-dependent alcohol dehydrogenase
MLKSTRDMVLPLRSPDRIRGPCGSTRASPGVLLRRRSATRDIPLYLDLYRQGRLNLDDLVTKRGRLGDINEAFRAMKAGELARTVLTFD